MTHRKNSYRIATSHQRKPIPTDRFDWAASFADDEPDDNGAMLIGWGATEEDAIDDLLDQCDRPFPILTRACSEAASLKRTKNDNDLSRRHRRLPQRH